MRGGGELVAACVRVPAARHASFALGSTRPRAETEVHMRQTRLRAKRQAQLAERAQGMRHAPTASEEALWRHLSGRQLGVSFRRQVPLAGRYIADFYAAAARLVVEVDGASHRTRATADARGDRVLARLGYRVLRLPAHLVLEQPLAAVARVRAALASGEH